MGKKGNGSGTEYPARPRVAVGAVVFKENRVLLVQRGKPPAAGQWCIPGGSVKLGETLQMAAEREIMEETGIAVRAREPVFHFETIEKDETGRIRFHYVIIDLAAEYVSGEIIAGDDARDARWVSSGELNELAVNSVTLNALQSLYSFGD